MVLLATMSVASGASHTVTTAVDNINAGDGVLSLREATIAAAVDDVIVFDGAVFPSGTVTTIPMVLGTLDLLTNGVWLKASGQIILDGSVAPGGASGIRIVGDEVRVTGLEIAGYPEYGIRVAAGVDAIVGGATADLGNLVRDNKRAGIRVGDDVAAIGQVLVRNNTVDGNCVSPTGFCGGIEVSGASFINFVRIAENRVTYTAGDPALSQGIGVLVTTGGGHVVEGNTVGDTVTDGNAGHGIVIQAPSGTVEADVEDNIVSGNGRNGILVGPRSQPCTVSGNLVGTDASGEAAVPNAGHGIAIFATDGHHILDNVVSGNAGSGIRCRAASTGTGSRTTCSTATTSEPTTTATPPSRTRSTASTRAAAPA